MLNFLMFPFRVVVDAMRGIPAQLIDSGIIPQGLRVILPVRSTQADNIAERTGHALVRVRIGEMHRQKEMLTGRITWLEVDLSRTLNADEWPRIDQLCRNAASTHTIM